MSLGFSWCLLRRRHYSAWFWIRGRPLSYTSFRRLCFDIIHCSACSHVISSLIKAHYFPHDYARRRKLPLLFVVSSRRLKRNKFRLSLDSHGARAICRNIAVITQIRRARQMAISSTGLVSSLLADCISRWATSCLSGDKRRLFHWLASPCHFLLSISQALMTLRHEGKRFQIFQLTSVSLLQPIVFQACISERSASSALTPLDGDKSSVYLSYHAHDRSELRRSWVSGPGLNRYFDADSKHSHSFNRARACLFSNILMQCLLIFHFSPCSRFEKLAVSLRWYLLILGKPGTLSINATFMIASRSRYYLRPRRLRYFRRRVDIEYAAIAIYTTSVVFLMSGLCRYIKFHGLHCRSVNLQCGNTKSAFISPHYRPFWRFREAQASFRENFAIKIISSTIRRLWCFPLTFR